MVKSGAGGIRSSEGLLLDILQLGLPVGQACPAGQCVIAVKACILKALGALEDLICWGGGDGVSEEERGGLSSQ